MKLERKEGSENYTATIVKITNLHQIEGADRIVRTVILGNDVVTQNTVKTGELKIYFNSGTKLNEEFCKWNDLTTDPEINRNKVKGYISHKQFRVKAIKLKSIISDGMLLPLHSLDCFDENFKNDLKEGDSFTTINDIELCEKYVVSVRNSNPGGKNPKQPQKISRLVENQFYLHNDTDNLRRNIHKINPNDIIGIHYKKHGTSAVFGNVLVKKNLKWYEKLVKKIGISVIETDYDIVYSSRKVVKNGYLNPEQKEGFYGEDIWGIVAKEIEHLIPKNWTLYGEILGYTPNGSAIQGKFDYGCEQGEHKFYVYKISVVNSDGKVIYLTDKQIEEYCEKVGLLYKDTFIYYGRAIDRFNYREEGKAWDVRTWQEKFLEVLEHTYNEKDCYMCNSKVPEEGIVLRIEHLESYEAYKLKSKKFLLMESDEQEKETINIEDNQ
jgi:hypothetical protein